MTYRVMDGPPARHIGPGEASAADLVAALADAEAAEALAARLDGAR